MLLPDPVVARRYGKSLRTLARWDGDQTLGFPKPVFIRKRKYRRSEELDQFDLRLGEQQQI